MGLPLPKQILVHGWWQKDGAKISKSTGNIVEPIAVIDEWGLDAFRYYVLRELDIGPDGNWTDAGFKSRYNAELANGLGNLVNRSLSMLKRYRKGVVPAKHDELAADTAKAAGETQALLKQNQLQSALQCIWTLVNRANLYVEQTKPFNLAKDTAQAKRLDEVLYNLAETCRVLAVLLWPFLPGTAQKIYAQLGLTGASTLRSKATTEDGPGKFTEATWGGLKPGHKIGALAPLFPRKEP
jgi:methionyl-tRNA synthetase